MNKKLIYSIIFYLISHASFANFDSLKKEKKYLQIANGYNNICAIDSNKKLECWSINPSINAIENIPSDVSDVNKLSLLGADPKQVVACALHHGNKLNCWGKDVNNILNNTPKTAKDISVAVKHACIINEQNTVHCWGNLMKEYPTPTDMGEVIQISSGPFFTCALTKINSIRCWGYGFDYSEIPSDFKASELSVGGNHLCARELNAKAGEDIKCFGMNGLGQIDVPKDLGEVNNFGAGDRNSCAQVKNDPASGKPIFRCWGDTETHQIDDIETMPKSLEYSQVTYGGYNVCAILKGDINCFGSAKKFKNKFGKSIPMKNLQSAPSPSESPLPDEMTVINSSCFHAPNSFGNIVSNNLLKIKINIKGNKNKISITSPALKIGNKSTFKPDEVLKNSYSGKLSCNNENEPNDTSDDCQNRVRDAFIDFDKTGLEILKENTPNTKKAFNFRLTVFENTGDAYDYLFKCE